MSKYARWERKLCGCVKCVADEKAFQASVRIAASAIALSIALSLIFLIA